MTPQEPMKTIFRYTLAPAEIPVGGPGRPTSTLTIAVANQTGSERECKKIAFALPPELSKGSISVSTTTSTWAISQSGPQGRYVAQPQGARTGLGAGEVVGFRFAGVEPAETPGPVTIEVSEVTDQTRQGEIDADLIDAKPAISAFTADFLYIAPGGEVTFSWGTFGADKVKLAWGTGEETFDGGSGSFAVKPQETITATLTAIKTGGEQRTAQLTVVFARPQVSSFGIRPDPAYVVAGGTATLSWKTLHAERCSLSFHAWGNEKRDSSDEVPPSSDGYRQTVKRSGTFTLQAIGKGHTDPRQQPVTAWVAPVVRSVHLIRLGPGPVRAGWTAKGAEKAVLSDPQGSGPVAPVTPGVSVLFPFTLAFYAQGGGIVTVRIESKIELEAWFFQLSELEAGISFPNTMPQVIWFGDRTWAGEAVPVEGDPVKLEGKEGNVRVPLPPSPPCTKPLWSGCLGGLSWEVRSWPGSDRVLAPSSPGGSSL